jgi:hypothetical protein
MHIHSVTALGMTRFALVVGLGAAHPAMAQDATTAHPTMAPLDQYLMADRESEIALARSAAPESISGNATILVLGRTGYDAAVVGTNGFVCMVDRGWTGPFDWPELWNPKIRAATCLNPQAARSILPIVHMRTTMVLAGRSTAEVISALTAAFENERLPNLERDAMSYMTSKSSYLTDEGAHNIPHLMFYTHVTNSKNWGSGAADSPVLSSPYWFFSPKEEQQLKGLPPMLVFLVALPHWSDGTPAVHQ